MAVPTFVDRVVLHVTAGRGGNGVASVHREKFKPLGGPDGGNGGPGGSVILRVDPDVTTLIDYHHSPHRRAEHGGHGAGAHRNGGHGEDLVLAVPDGTVVSDEHGDVLADLVGPGTEMVIAEGGRGGLGNAALASSKRKAPGFALLGEPGDDLTVVLELKVVADIGLVGFPSAGKSSLIAALSRARPKIADYPFTTLVPNLGVVTAGDTTFTVADVPGLIEGASEGRGLGHDFLRHVERCAALVHVIDSATMEPGRDPLSDLDVIEDELSKYGGLEDRPRLVVLNKIDVPDGRDLADIVLPDLEARGLTVFPVSAASHEGLRELSFAMAEIVAANRPRAPGGGGHPDRASGRTSLRRSRVHHQGDRRGLARARREARALGAPDRLQQRRGGRLPRRPAQPARRRGEAARARRPGGRRRPHRRRRQRGRLRLRADDGRRRRDPRPARRGQPVRGEPSRRPVAAARSTRRCPRAARARRGPTWPGASASWTPTPTRRPAATHRTSAGTRTTPTRGTGRDVGRLGTRLRAGSRTRPPRRGGRGPGRGQGRLVVADHRRGRHRPGPGQRPRRRARRAPGPRRGGRARLLGRDRGRAGPARRWPAGRATWPPSRRRRRSARGCWCTATPRSSPGTTSSSARCCSPSTTSPGAATTATPTAPSPSCSSWACSRSSTRTTPSPPPRSGSATTTGWRRSWRTSCTPTCSCCSPTSTGSTTGTPTTTAPRC